MKVNCKDCYYWYYAPLYSKINTFICHHCGNVNNKKAIGLNKNNDCMGFLSGRIFENMDIAIRNRGNY